MMKILIILTGHHLIVIERMLESSIRRYSNQKNKSGLMIIKKDPQRKIKVKLFSL